MDDASDTGRGLEDGCQELREDCFAGWDVGDGLERFGVEHRIAKDSHFHLRLLEFLLEILDNLRSGEHFGIAHHVSHLTREVGADVWHSRFCESFAHVAVLGDGAIGTPCPEAVAELRELLHGETRVIDDDQVGRRVDAIQQAVDDDFLIWIHMRWRTVD